MGIHDASVKKKLRRSPSINGPPGFQPLPHHAATVVEDSQSTELPRFASLAEIMGDQAGSQGAAPDEDFTGLFPLTPSRQSQCLEVSQLTISRSRVTSREGVDKPETHKEGLGSPHESLSHPQSQVNTHYKADIQPSRSVDNSQPGVQASQPVLSKSPLKIHQRQHVSHGTAQAPRSILKTSLQDSRGEKRNVAGFEEYNAAGFTIKKRKSHNRTDMTKDLGPVVKDSQSPVSAISSRARKQTTTRRKSRGE